MTSDDERTGLQTDATDGGPACVAEDGMPFGTGLLAVVAVIAMVAGFTIAIAMP